MFLNSVPDTINTVSLDLAGLKIAALRSNEGKPHRVLAVHGWLDNANSFVPLMPLLPNIDLVAIDLPGHGHSAHLGVGAQYHLIDIMTWALAAADALGWKSFHYMGHSMGGCLAPFIAVARPDSVTSIIMLEATGPLTEAADKLPERLRRANLDPASIAAYKPRVFTTVKQAVEARLKATIMSRSSAQLIVERQLREVPDGLSWRYDRRHQSTSSIYFTEAHLIAVLKEVRCPTLVVTAKDGYLSSRRGTTARLAQIESLTHHSVEGHHHMHMDDPTPTADCIKLFLPE